MTHFQNTSSARSSDQMFHWPQFRQCFGAYDLKTVPYVLLSVVPEMEGIYMQLGRTLFLNLEWLFVEFMEPLFTHMPGESYRKELWSSLLSLRDVLQVLIISLVCWWKMFAVALTRKHPTKFNISFMHLTAAPTWWRIKGEINWNFVSQSFLYIKQNILGLQAQLIF